MELTSKATGSWRKYVERDGDAQSLADDVFDKVVRKGPLSDMWRLTLWANCYCEPIFAVMSQEFDVGRDEFNVLSCLASYGGRWLPRTSAT